KQMHVALSILAECPCSACVGIAVVGATAPPPVAGMPRSATGGRCRATRRQTGEIIARVSGTQVTGSVLCRCVGSDGQVVILDERWQPARRADGVDFCEGVISRGRSHNGVRIGAKAEQTILRAI